MWTNSHAIGYARYSGYVLIRARTAPVVRGSQREIGTMIELLTQRLASARHASSLTRAAIALSFAILTSTEPAQAAGTAYGVDTADVGEAGGCKIEGWTSFARSGDGLTTVSPSCIVSNIPRMEFVVQATRGRAEQDWYTSVASFLKFNLVPTEIGRFGFGLIVGATYDAVNDETASNFAYIPATLRLSNTLRVNLNGGWIGDRTNDQHFASYGAGFDWLFMPKFSMTAEAFGQINGDDLGWETRPRFQGGVRYRPVDDFSVDLIYGRNINGEGSHWLTLSTAYRFSLF